MLKLDLHVHTKYSGDSPCEVEEVIRAGIENDLNGLAITDHNTVSGLDEALRLGEEEDFLVIPGIEVSSADGHILGLGIMEEIEEGLSASETVKKIRDFGGIAISAHPFSLGTKPFAPLRADFDAIEVFNPRRCIGNYLAREFAEKNNVPMVAGSDAHYLEEVGLAGIRVSCDSSVESVLSKIVSGEVSRFGNYLPLGGLFRRAGFLFSKI